LRKISNLERDLNNPTALRLPLRHEVGERAGVRWCFRVSGAKLSPEIFSAITKSKHNYEISP
jgi:hypothetical protein